MAFELLSSIIFKSHFNTIYLISMIVKFHLGCFFLMAAATSDSVGFFLLTVTEVEVPEFITAPPVELYRTLTFTVGILFL